MRNAVILITKYIFTVYSLVGQECKDARQNTAGPELAQLIALSQAPIAYSLICCLFSYISNTLTYK